jgi:hypothetical protein
MALAVSIRRVGIVAVHSISADRVSVDERIQVGAQVAPIGRIRQGTQNTRCKPVQECR